MKIRFHGKLARDYGPEHEIKANTIAEAVEGLTRQIGFYSDQILDERPVVNIVGHDTVDSLSENPESIDIIPAIHGGSGVGKILVGAALIGLALTGVGAGIALGGMSLSGVFLSVGVGLALSGIAQLFTKAPSLSREEDPEASKYLGISNNTTKLGTLRSYSMGRVKITAPHLLALNVDSTDLIRGEFPA